MGYYTGSAVTTEKRKYTNCVHNGWQFGAFIDGQGMFPYLLQVFRTYTEATSVKRGIAEPSDNDLAPSTTVSSNGTVIASTIPTARRIGDSNLWELTTNTMTSVETTNTGAPIS